MSSNSKLMTEIIILLDGNFASIKVDDINISKVTGPLTDILTGNVDLTHKIYTIGHVTLRIDKIIGYYTRPVVESAQDKLVKILEKTVDQTNDGDEWKTGGK